MRIKFFASIRELTGEIDREWSDPAGNVRELLQQLTIYYGNRFQSKIFKSDGGLSEEIIILINGRDLRHLSGLDTQLAPDDSISIFPVVAGG